MMGKRSAQDKLFAAYHVYLDFVGRDTCTGTLAQNREQMFRDEDFAALYCPDNGRQSVSPSMAVSVLFLRACERVSLAEAVERTKYDLRWRVALGLEMEEVPMQKNALQEFDAKLVLHDEMGEPILQKSIQEARRADIRRIASFACTLDTTPILGRISRLLGPRKIVGTSPEIVGTSPEIDWGRGILSSVIRGHVRSFAAQMTA